MGDFWATFFYILVMVAVIAGAYVATKYIAGKGGSAKSRHIRIIDRMMLGRDKHIVLIEVGDRNLLIGVTNQSINMLGDISGETLKNRQNKNDETAQKQKCFASQLRDFMVYVKDAPGNLRKARMEDGKARYSSARDDDYLARMDEAIQKRKTHIDGRDKGEE